MYTNLLTQIKNAQAVGKESVKVQYSKMDEAVLALLAKNGYIETFEKKGRNPKRVLNIKLKYDGKKGAISGIKFISKPSRHIYAGWADIKPVKHGYGLSVVSTSKGIVSGKEARKMKIGGEVLFKIW